MTSRLTLLLAVLITMLVTVLVAVCWPSPAQAAGTDPVGVWPLVPEPEVVQGFDPPDDPWGAGHRGVDLLGTVGQPVRSALPGRVSWAGVLAGRGVVVVDHGTTRTTYEPVTATDRVGDRVAAGDRIGVLELAGSHCFPRACLHWGWLQGETYLDPLRLVGAGPVRLLPLWREDPVTTPVVPPLLRSPYDRWRSPGLDTPVATSYLTRAARSTTISGSADASPLRLWDAPAGRPGGAGLW